jgi:acetylornithine/succinyldiaminopimelate/putrescine aminotransferase
MKSDFLTYLAQTSPHPLILEIESANGSYIYDTDGKEYLDFVAGVSANTLGHNPKKVVQAIKDQIDKYMHVMVYGEFVQQPQVELAKFLATKLPESLHSVYLTNSGTEAAEGAIKLAKRVTGRYEIIAAKNGYHGNTQGAMSVCGKEEQNGAFRPLIPGVKFIEFNYFADINKITAKTAAIILETIQGGAGFVQPQNDYLRKVKERCEEVGALLILDEIQSGIGRTGKFFGFENYNVIPDIFITGKGLGGGMPIGAFISSYTFMSNLKENPKLGHITTFGGHPVIAAAALATLQELCRENLILDTLKKEQLFRKLLVHESIVEIRGKGLMLAIMLEDNTLVDKIILESLQNGLILFWLLFEKKAIRITPPLTISEAEIKKGCSIILQLLDKYSPNK